MRSIYITNVPISPINYCCSQTTLALVTIQQQTNEIDSFKSKSYSVCLPISELSRADEIVNAYYS